MSKKYDVESIVGKDGKHIPQIITDDLKEAIPLTESMIKPQVNVDIPTEQDVNIKNDELKVNVDNLPQNQDVTLTNDTIDVNVTNQTDNVEVNNLPNDYPDSAVKAELESIKQQQADILAKLNDTIDTRLTGSNAEYNMLTEGSVIIPPGTSWNSNSFEQLNFSKITVFSRTSVASDTKISILALNPAQYFNQADNTVTGSRFNKTDVSDVQSAEARVVIKNEGESDITVDRLYRFTTR